jgi:hypothetical protein
MQAERDYDLNRAAELKYGTLVSLQAQLRKVEEELAAKSSSGAGMLREEVTEDDISEVISRCCPPTLFCPDIVYASKHISLRRMLAFLTERIRMQIITAAAHSTPMDSLCCTQAGHMHVCGYV